MRVGVVVPVVNGEPHVADAIDSVLAQTHDDFELVVVDGDSSDGTRAIVTGYDDPRVSLVGNDERHGIAAARNQGVERVDGELVAFLDHDDVWHPDKLARHVECHRTTGADLVYSDVRVVDTDGTVLQDAHRPDPEPPGAPLVRQLLLDDRVVVLTASSVTVRRSAWRAVGGFDPAFRVSEDAEFYVRLAGEHAFAHIPEHLVVKRDRAGSLSDDYRGMYRAHQRLLETALDRYPFLDEQDVARRRARTAWHRATSALLAGDPVDAVDYGWETFTHAPGIRPLLVVALGLLDRLVAPFGPGHRLLTRYHHYRRERRNRL